MLTFSTGDITHFLLLSARTREQRIFIISRAAVASDITFSPSSTPTLLKLLLVSSGKHRQDQQGEKKISQSHVIIFDRRA